jgi:hypothetical protein
MASSISLWVSTLGFAVQVIAGLVLLAAGGQDGGAVLHDGLVKVSPPVARVVVKLPMMPVVSTRSGS